MQESESVQQVVFVAPILPGKREAYVRFTQELLGRRREAYEASRRRLGVTREQFWLLETAGQLMAVVALTTAEATPVEAFSALLSNRRPFNRWLQRNLQELHGLDLREGRLEKRAPLPHLIAEWTAPASPNGRPNMPADSHKGGN